MADKKPGRRRKAESACRAVVPRPREKAEGALHSGSHLPKLSAHGVVCRHCVRINATPRSRHVVNALEHERPMERATPPLRIGYRLLAIAYSREAREPSGHSPGRPYFSSAKKFESHPFSKPQIEKR
jgi:hypothetical protein